MMRGNIFLRPLRITRRSTGRAKSSAPVSSAIRRQAMNGVMPSALVDDISANPIQASSR